MKPFLLFSWLSILLSFKSNCQSLTGTWQALDNSYKIVIIHIKDSCFGYTYDTGLGYCKANFTGIYNDSTKKLKGVNTDFIQKTFFHGLSRYQLYYSKDTEGEYLKGSAGVKSLVGNILYLGMGIPLLYKKISNSFDTTLFMGAKLALYSGKPVALNNMKKIPANDEKDSLVIHRQEIAEISRQKEIRKSQIVNSIVTDADSLRLLLHDNGEIDNDTVTVFLNGKIIIDRLGLKVTPYETRIAINTKDSVQSIELMANNLGSIPPNTAYLTIWAGKEKYELRVSSDYTVNARIDIRYKPKE